MILVLKNVYIITEISTDKILFSVTQPEPGGFAVPHTVQAEAGRVCGGHEHNPLPPRPRLPRPQLCQRQSAGNSACRPRLAHQKTKGKIGFRRKDNYLNNEFIKVRNSKMQNQFTYQLFVKI